MRSKASTLENEAIPLQPNPLYGVSTNVDNTDDYEIVETPIHMKQNPVYDVTTTLSDDIQLQINVVYGVLNDEQTSQVENEGTDESPQQLEYDYVQI